MARWVIDLSPGTEIVPCNGRPGVMVNDAIGVLRRDGLSCGKLLPFLLGPFEFLLDAGGITRLNQVLQLARERS